jgi:hypothetical protein
MNTFFMVADKVRHAIDTIASGCNADMFIGDLSSGKLRDGKRSLFVLKQKQGTAEVTPLRYSIKT